MVRIQLHHLPAEGQASLGLSFPISKVELVIDCLLGLLSRPSTLIYGKR